jgi:hypothetical protein
MTVFTLGTVMALMAGVLTLAAAEVVIDRME